MAMVPSLVECGNVKSIHIRNMDSRHRPFAIEHIDDTRITAVSFAVSNSNFKTL